MKKQLAAVMLSVCMMLMLLPTTAFAVENYDLYLYLGSEYVGTRITSEQCQVGRHLHLWPRKQGSDDRSHRRMYH